MEVRDTFSPRCVLTWRGHDPHIDVGSGGRPHDTVYVDAGSGTVLLTVREAADYTGTVTHSTWWPGDTSMVQRGMPWGQLRSWNGSAWDIGTTEEDGSYDWTPLAEPPLATARLTSGPTTPPGWMELRHAVYGDCIDDPDDVGFYADGGGIDIVIESDPTTWRRADWVMYYILQWSNEMFNRSNFAAELPNRLWFDAAGGSAGAMRWCPTAEHLRIAAGAGTDQLEDYPRMIDVLWEELHHAVDACTQTVGPGCYFTYGGGHGLLGARHENWGAALGNSFNRYLFDTRVLLPRYMHHLRYAGPAADPGDILLDDAEIEGTPTTGTHGCDPVQGTYVCATDEACWLDAADRPRCMYRSTPSGTPTPTDYVEFCQSLPQLSDITLFGLIDAQPDGTDSDGENIWICRPSNYANGAVWALLSHNLIQGGGYYYGVGAANWAARGLTSTRTFTQGSDNFHEEMAVWAGWYESSRGFRAASTESFPWLDDATDNWMGSAEVIRMPRTAPLMFAEGGPTGDPLRFFHANTALGASPDADYFAVTVDPHTVYRIDSFTEEESVDLCIEVWDLLSGEPLASSAGCSDGAVTPEQRNATVTFSSSGHLVAFLMTNVMKMEGKYQFQIESVDDDYPDLLSEYMTSAPLRTDEVTPGTFESPDETDLFRYDVPAGHGSFVDLMMQDVAGASASIEVYEVAPPSAPGGAPIASGVGSVGFTVTVGMSYYVLVRGEFVGTYQVKVVPDSCGAECDLRGTYDDPLPLPSDGGGIVSGRLAENAHAAGFDYPSCRDGITCDWYWMDLQRGERMSATVFRVYDESCALELSVFAPPEQGYYGAPQGRLPSVTDQNGSMETLGAQLMFEAQADGRYRVRVQTTHAADMPCPGYDMTVVRGPFSLPWIAPHVP